MAVELKIRLSKAAVDPIIGNAGPLPIMMLFHCHRRGVLRALPDKKTIVERIGPVRMHGRFWILGYEAARQEWLSKDDLRFAGWPPATKSMLDHSVSFFSPEAIPYVFSAIEGDDVRKVTNAIESTADDYEDTLKEVETPGLDDLTECKTKTLVEQPCDPRTQKSNALVRRKLVRLTPP
jgi:hypothetical protein